MASPQRRELKLDQFLKLSQITDTGGQAKLLIQSGEVWVNGAVETRRGRKLQVGDQIQVADQVWTVTAADLTPGGAGSPDGSVPNGLRY